MQTHFSAAQLENPDIARADRILRACVHCGFCTATCPTYVLLGDERDSPRGRIYLIKDMLEKGKPASEAVVTHLDRCLSCLACMTTCPSGVNYMHLVDQARHHIEETYRRPPADRLLRRALAFLTPRPQALRWALRAGRLALPLRRLLRGAGEGSLARRLRALLDQVPARLPRPSPVDRPQVFPAQSSTRLRVALLSGCAQTVLAPGVNEATIRLLTRHGVEVIVAAGAGCCGSSVLHLGQRERARALARDNIAAWDRLIDGAGLDAIVVNASGCGTTLKDYGHLLADDPDWAPRAARVAGLARDVSELMQSVGLHPPSVPTGHRVAYHAACSMQHGQRLIEPPKALLRAAGFRVEDVPEGHLCCGWAGTYNILQPELSARLRERKVANIERLKPDLVAAGNFGCIGNIAGGTGLPVVHTVELLDWATGGPPPAALHRAGPAGGAAP